MPHLTARMQWEHPQVQVAYHNMWNAYVSQVVAQRTRAQTRTSVPAMRSNLEGRPIRSPR